MPAPYLPDLILRRIAGDVVASEMLYLGEFIDSSDAEKKGIVTSMFPKSDVEDKALEIVASVAKLPAKAFQASKANRVEAIRSSYENSFRAKNEAFLDCWFSSETQELLSEAAKKF